MARRGIARSAGDLLFDYLEWTAIGQFAPLLGNPHSRRMFAFDVLVVQPFAIHDDAGLGPVALQCKEPVVAIVEDLVGELPVILEAS